MACACRNVDDGGACRVPWHEDPFRCEPMTLRGPAAADFAVVDGRKLAIVDFVNDVARRALPALDRDRPWVLMGLVALGSPSWVSVWLVKGDKPVDHLSEFPRGFSVPGLALPAAWDGRLCFEVDPSDVAADVFVKFNRRKE